MEKKSLGRGLEDISDIFLSSKKDEIPDEAVHPGFSSEKIRDAACEDCVNVSNESATGLKCRIFTFENQRYHVQYLNTISSTSASYCHYFNPPVQHGESGSGKKSEAAREIEESGTLHRTISFPGGPEVQQHILNALSEHLEKGYTVNRIELKKTDRVFRPGTRKCVEEAVTLQVKA